MQEALSALDNVKFLNTVTCTECGVTLHKSVIDIHRKLAHKFKEDQDPD